MTRSSGAQIMAAFAELSQSSVSEVVDVDKAIRGGLMAVGFPQYAIRTSQEIKKIRDAEKQAAEEARQAQLSEIKAKALSNTGRGMQAMNSSGVDVASAFGGGQGQYDDRMGSKVGESKIHRYFRMNLRNLRFVKHYPTEALSEPLFRTWFALWKKIHGIR